MTLRAIHILAVFFCLISASVSTSAMSFDVVSFDAANRLPFSPLRAGDEFTIGLRVSGGLGTFGLGASAWGYEPSMFEFVRGEAVGSINHAVCIPAVGCFAGLANGVGGSPLQETTIGANGPRVSFFSGMSCCATHSNPLDPGLDGIIGGNDAQVRMTFRLLREGSGQIRIGTGHDGDGEVLAGGFVDQTAETVLNVAIIPEPATATLLGLGLALLSAAGAHRPD